MSREELDHLFSIILSLQGGILVVASLNSIILMDYLFSGLFISLCELSRVATALSAWVLEKIHMELTWPNHSLANFSCLVGWNRASQPWSASISWTRVYNCENKCLLLKAIEFWDHCYGAYTGQYILKSTYTLNMWMMWPTPCCFWEVNEYNFRKIVWTYICSFIFYLRK